MVMHVGCLILCSLHSSESFDIISWMLMAIHNVPKGTFIEAYFCGTLHHDKTEALFCGAQKCHEQYHIHRINVWYIDLHLWVKYTIHWSYGIHLQYIDPMEMCSHVCVTHTLWQGTEVSPKWWRHRPVQSGVNWWCHHPHTGRHSECRFPEVLWPRITKNSRITWKHVLPIPSTYGLLYWLTRG